MRVQLEKRSPITTGIMESTGRLLARSVAVGVVRLPVPEIAAHFIETTTRVPAEFLRREGGVCVAFGDVAFATWAELVRQRAATGSLHGFDHIQHGIANASAQVEH